MNIQEILTQSDYIISFGSMLSYDNEEAKEAIIQSIANNNAEFIYMHPMDDMDLKVYYSQFIKYEVGSEEGIATMLMQNFVKSSNETLQAFIDDLDIGYISAESSAGEEELEEAYESAEGKTTRTLLVGDDIATHDSVQSIVKLLSVIAKYSDLKVVALDEKLQAMIDECSNEDIEEVDDLESYNGTLLYRYEGEETSLLVGSNSFARVAKISDGDEIIAKAQGGVTKRTFKVDKNLQGTIALCAIDNSEDNGLFQAYRYKQVKIEKVDE